MKQWQEIRHRILKQGVSKRQILRETGMHWQTLEKILEHSSPPGYCLARCTIYARRPNTGHVRRWRITAGGYAGFRPCDGNGQH